MGWDALEFVRLRPLPRTVRIARRRLPPMGGAGEGAQCPRLRGYRRNEYAFSLAARRCPLRQPVRLTALPKGAPRLLPLRVHSGQIPGNLLRILRCGRRVYGFTRGGSMRHRPPHGLAVLPCHAGKGSPRGAGGGMHSGIFREGRWRGMPHQEVLSASFRFFLFVFPISPAAATPISRLPPIR